MQLGLAFHNYINFEAYFVDVFPITFACGTNTVENACPVQADKATVVITTTQVRPLFPLGEQFDLKIEGENLFGLQSNSRAALQNMEM